MCLRLQKAGGFPGHRQKLCDRKAVMFLMDKSFVIPISRRDFMKLVGLGTVGMMAGASEGSAEAAPEPVGASGEGLPTILTADVCVCGGGPAGVAAAITAAKNGKKTVLVERGIALGGLATMGCVYPCMPTFAYDSDTPYINELNERMTRKGHKVLLGIETDTFYGGGAGQYIPEVLMEVYDEMCEAYGVTVLYHASVVGAETGGGEISSCVVHTLEGLAKIQAKVFIDATGDAALSRFAGVPHEKGSAKTGRNQPMSFRFEMGGIDENKAYNFFTKKLKDTWSQLPPPHFEFAKWKKTEEFFKGGVARGELAQDDILYIQAFTIAGKDNTMSMNCPEMPPLDFSATDAVSYSKAVAFGRKMMRRLAGFFIKNIPGFEKAYISREASVLGVRESWRIRGKYYMTDKEYTEARHFPDAVARTAYPIDIHDVNLDLSKKLKKGEYYEIPYRALVTNEYSNLIVAGRCISASFAAQASVRIQPTCMSMGEAAGIAAAWGLDRGIPVNEIKWEEIPAEKRSYVSNSPIAASG